MSGADVALRLDRHETFRATFIYKDSDGAAIDISAYTLVDVELVAGTTLSLDQDDPHVTITPLTGTIELVVTTVQMTAFTSGKGTIRILLTNPLAAIEDIIELVDGVFELVD